jgi:hypothetical protein
MVVAVILSCGVAAAGEPASRPPPSFPPLPQAVSSFGAAVSDGWLYVYGGHCAKTHNYSTEAVLGTFYRVSLSSPGAWQKLPDGPPVQGLALVAHGDKIYRIGGMQPRNKPGDKAGRENRSFRKPSISNSSSWRGRYS